MNVALARHPREHEGLLLAMALMVEGKEGDELLPLRLHPL